ncbi:hypothetical protein ACIPYS_17755 [Kitasatospora sp. NPDC089913]|uniref:hypothetical protein n=1 Tax=Kitasatospora sp. NPDC089913 TaxID=3364080 RepID=UPI0038144D6E
MREFTNLGWPEIPFSADQRPVARHVRLTAGFAVQWTDDGERAVPLAIAAVFVPVHRTATTILDPTTAHFGYRVVVAGAEDQAALVDVVDELLVQARRDAAGIGWHAFLDDAHALINYAGGRTRGISAMVEAWADRRVREPGTAPLVDTAEDVDLDGWSVLAACRAVRLHCPVGDGGLIPPNHIQDLAETDPAGAVEKFGSSALLQALAVALLAGKQKGLLDWPDGFDLGQLATAVAWDAFPTVFNAGAP